MAEHSFELLADFHQITISDERVDVDELEPDPWTEEAFGNRVASEPKRVSIRTARNSFVPVDVEICEARPAVELEDYDHAVECSISVPSGRLVVAGLTEPEERAAHVDLDPGTYCVYVLLSGLGSVNDDGTEGADRYRLILWPGERADVRLLKRFDGSY